MIEVDTSEPAPTYSDNVHDAVANHQHEQMRESAQIQQMQQAQAQQMQQVQTQQVQPVQQMQHQQSLFPPQYRFQGPMPIQHKFSNNHQVQVKSLPKLPFPTALDIDFDGRRLRRTTMRKTVDYNSAIVKHLENRIWQRDHRDRDWLQPDVLYVPHVLPPSSYAENPYNAITTRFVKTSTNKVKCPVFCMSWTPEGRRLITGTSSGEFTLWNGLTFNFETILQAHDTPVRTMVWSHNEQWMLTGDHAGFLKYWQSNMNNVKSFQGHREAARGVSFSPTDNKFVSCSDDGTVRLWDFFTHSEERIFRGHGADVKCVDWHPIKSLIASGSKDNQQPVKLWDPRTGKSIVTLHAHKATVMDLKWNTINGNWVATASRDHLIKLYDLRNLNTELQTFRGHKKETSVLAWHPHHEGLLASGGSDGSLLFWNVGVPKEIASIDQAHDSIVWALAWHPLGHILCSGSNDHSCKFWTRNHPGDPMRDKYNLNLMPASILGFDEVEDESGAVCIPGMGPEDRVDISKLPVNIMASIPGLDNNIAKEKNRHQKKIPFSKPIPKVFQQQWNAAVSNPVSSTLKPEPSVAPVVDPEKLLQKVFDCAPGACPVDKICPNWVYIHGKVVIVEKVPMLHEVIQDGEDSVFEYADTGNITMLQRFLPMIDHYERAKRLKSQELMKTYGRGIMSSLFGEPDARPMDCPDDRESPNKKMDEEQQNEDGEYREEGELVEDDEEMPVEGIRPEVEDYEMRDDDYSFRKTEDYRRSGDFGPPRGNKRGGSFRRPFRGGRKGRGDRNFTGGDRNFIEGDMDNYDMENDNYDNYNAKSMRPMDRYRDDDEYYGRIRPLGKDIPYGRGRGADRGPRGRGRGNVRRPLRRSRGSRPPRRGF